ncbi:MAG: hypothetical protein IAE63_04135 [Alphaproteobacteria bacterium]|nr:hypothetical protein [Alphaproteobacteria bacterium]
MTTINLSRAVKGQHFITQDGREAIFIARDDGLERPYIFRVGNRIWTRLKNGRHCETCNGQVYPAIVAKSVTPLFIPLKSEHYDNYLSGKKTFEMRLYGTRWNERTCYDGRPVTLSKGYGKKNRLYGYITGFNKFDAHGYSKETRDQIIEIFGTLEKPIAHISIELNKHTS